MKRSRTIALFKGVILLLCMSQDQTALAQPQIRVQGAAPILVVTTGTASRGILPVINNSSQLRFRQSTGIRKITVSTFCPGQKFTLSVEAIRPSIGVATPPVFLIDGMPEADIITDIPRGNRQHRAGLRYVAAPIFSQGNSIELGDDNHVVTYTIIQQ